MNRRRALAAATMFVTVRRAAATPEAMAEASRDFTGGVVPRSGRVQLEIAPLVENGNTVPVAVSVASPMTSADHVAAIAIFTPRNPLPPGVRFELGPRAGRATVATRLRLAPSQPGTAIARLSDGSCWSQSVEVEVTLAACVE
jgi:sulfur-oxidizing protein SoxY